MPKVQQLPLPGMARLRSMWPSLKSAIAHKHCSQFQDEISQMAMPHAMNMSEALAAFACFLQDPKKRADANTILQHDWMRENGTASERPLDNVILKRMRGFAAMNKLKKEALKVIAAGMSQEEIAGLRTMFQVSLPRHQQKK